MATIHDVAQRAGVSIATVSNAFNASAPVRDSTRARVFQAAAELRYRQGHLAGASKRAGVSRTVGIITEDITVFNTPTIVSAIGQAACALHYDVISADLRLVQKAGSLRFDDVFYLEPARGAINTLLAHNVSGVIYVGSQSREIRNIAEGYHSPIVFAYCYSSLNNALSVVYDDENISYDLTTYLLKNGHTNIGVIAGPEDSHHVRGRMTGYQRALFQQHILYNPQNVLFGDWDNPRHGYLGASQLWKRGASAIFCMNDLLASGVVDYALSNGINVPEQLSVVGFDDSERSATCFPKLTTVALPLWEIGEIAMQRLVQILEAGSPPQAPELITLPCRIVYRDSVAAKESRG